MRGADVTNSTKIGVHLPINNKLMTEVISFKRSAEVADLSPHKSSKKCSALKPSLPLEVPLENDLIQPKTLPILQTNFTKYPIFMQKSHYTNETSKVLLQFAD